MADGSCSTYRLDQPVPKIVDRVLQSAHGCGVLPVGKQTSDCAVEIVLHRGRWHTSVIVAPIVIDGEAGGGKPQPVTADATITVMVIGTNGPLSSYASRVEDLRRDPHHRPIFITDWQLPRPSN